MVDSLWGAAGKWDIMKCTNSTCGLLWIDPMPDFGDMARLYEQYYTHSENNPQRKLKSGFYEKIRRSVLTCRFGYTGILQSRIWRFVGRVVGYLPLVKERIGRTVMWLPGSDCGRLLDIGCGDGKLLGRMRDVGWEVVGIEPDHRAAERARKKHGLDVREASVEEAGFPEASFDVITMQHVLEHLIDPVGTLRECGRILRPGGRLVVLTPNSASSGLKRYGPDWRGLEPPRHLHIFGPGNIRRAMQDAGFAVESVETTSCCGASLWLNSDYIRRKRLGTWRSPTDCGTIRRRVNRVLQRLKYVQYSLRQTLLHRIDDSSGEEILAFAAKPQ